jgi:para-nitrobenzyl esterase
MPNTSKCSVEFAQGVVSGIFRDGATCFHGVPYAEPPVGDLRFAPPQPARPWQGEHDGTRIHPLSLQTLSRLRNVMGDLPREKSENCLTLTVWTPAPDQRRRPVIVWLHGGAFATGGGDLGWYDGARMAQAGDVVVVGVNYRLGALGFLRAQGLAPGNLGLMDQELAVRWVSEHIAAFGGDPDNITLMGQSAGGLSIALLLMRETLVPIKRAIMMSAPLGLQLFTPEFSELIGQAYVRALGIDPLSGDVAARVRSQPEAAVLQAQGSAAAFFLQNLCAPGDITPPFIPVADGEYLPTLEAMPAALARAASRCDVMIGTNRDEAAAFFPDTWEPAMTANTFELSSIRWARDAAAAGRQAYLYRFDWAPHKSPFGAAHCIELPFAFDSFHHYSEAPMVAGAPRSETNALASTVRSIWTQYAHTGVPGRPDLPSWPACTPQQTPRFHFDRQHHMTAVTD